MKKLLTICAVAGFIFIAPGPATADFVMPPWAGQDGTVYAEWNDWTGFPSPMPPDFWESYPDELQSSPAAYAFGTSSLLTSYAGRNNVIQLNEDNGLIFDIPNFGPNEHKEVWIQVTYYPAMQGQSPWFDIGTTTESDVNGPFFIDSVEFGGWVTDIWSLQIWPNPEREEIALNFSIALTGLGATALDIPYPAYIDQVAVDTWCIPEPTTIFLLGLGTLSFLRSSRQKR
ncbi:MAG: PEP-CTERM sorting domain-containing protein [Phycisphaerae bacterium]|nr:PEP-CTERM sorting domain-containing protein [Phycisphaerae bacterium]